MGKFAIGCGGLLLVLLIIGGFLASRYNSLVTLRQGTNEKWAQVQTQYQRRADLVPNLVNTVQGAANFERQTLTDVIQARQQVTNLQIDPNSAPTDPATLQRFAQTQESLSGALSRLLVVIERYPDIKANANFQNLQAQLEGTENRIAVARNDFNTVVRDYNTTLQRFPTNLVAGLFGFQIRPYFESAPGAEIAPNVQFNFGASPAPAATAAPVATP